MPAHPNQYPSAEFSQILKDGRHLRSFRTKKKITDATASLLERVERITTQKIADEAGVSLRNLFERFGELDTVLKETCLAVFADGLKFVPSRALSGDLMYRLPKFMEGHVKFCEMLLPLYLSPHTAQMMRNMDDDFQIAFATTVSHAINRGFGPELADTSITLDKRDELERNLKMILHPENWAFVRKCKITPYESQRYVEMLVYMHIEWASRKLE